MTRWQGSVPCEGLVFSQVRAPVFWSMRNAETAPDGLPSYSLNSLTQ